MNEAIKTLTQYSQSELEVKLSNTSKDDIIKILEHFNIPYRKYESRKKLIKHAANEISSLGIYQRIANTTGRRD